LSLLTDMDHKGMRFFYGQILKVIPNIYNSEHIGFNALSAQSTLWSVSGYHVYVSVQATQIINWAGHSMRCIQFAWN